MYVRRPPPAIGARVNWEPVPPPPRPIIASRINWTPERIACSEVERRGQQPNAEDLQSDHTGQRDHPAQHDSGGERPPSPTAPRTRSNRFAKPIGEPGRPGSGGYCIETVLIQTHGWKKETVIEVNEAVRAEARRKLNTTLSYRGQSAETIRAICDEIERQWPELKEYHDCWPVRSMLKLVLKYASEASRRAQTQEMNRRFRAAARGTTPS